MGIDDVTEKRIVSIYRYFSHIYRYFFYIVDISAATLLYFAPQVDLAFCGSGILSFEFLPPVALI
jgi:hypothetical protein